MSDQWAPPVPTRPPGWVPHDKQQYHDQYASSHPYVPPQQYSQQSYPSQQPYQTQHQPYEQQQYNYQPQYLTQQSYQQPQYYGYQQQYPPQQSAAPPGPSPQQHYQPLQQPQYQPQAQRFWQPVSGTSWQMVLHDPAKIDHTAGQYAVWVIDVFDNPAETVTELHNRGCKVIGYFSGGTYEDWRPDAKRFPKADLGKDMDDWEGEKWVRTSSPAVRQIMIERMELALSKGFDGIDVDNVDGYDHKTGLNLTHDTAVDYIKFLTREAHTRGLACGLKNASDIIPRVIDDVQWIVQEQCVQYSDEEEYLPFIRKGKPVFHVEYPKGEDTESSKCNNEKEVTGKQLQKCLKAKNMGFSTIIKNIKLDQWIQVV